MEQPSRPKDEQKVKRPRSRMVQVVVMTTTVLIQAILNHKINKKTVEGVKFTRSSLYQVPDTKTSSQVLVTSDGRVFNGEEPYTLQDSSGNPLQVPAKNSIQLTINHLLVVQHPEGQHPNALILKRDKPEEGTFKVDPKNQQNGSLQGLGALKTYSVDTASADQEGTQIITFFDGGIKILTFSHNDNLVSFGGSSLIPSTKRGYREGII